MTTNAETATPELSVLIVNYNSWGFCIDALESFVEFAPTRRDGSPMPFEVIVVDNDSPQRDEVKEAQLRGLLERINGRLIMHDANPGYGGGMNLAYENCVGDTILVSNPDVRFTAGCVDRMLRYLEEHDDVGQVGPEVFVDLGVSCRLPPNNVPDMVDLIATTFVAVSPKHVERYSRQRTEFALSAWINEESVDLPQISGCCFAMKRKVIEKLGVLFDTRYPLYYEDTDLSVRVAKAGLRLVQVKDSRLIHLYDRCAQTVHEESMRRYWVSRRAFYRKWYGPFGGWMFDFSRWLLDTKWMHRLGRRAPQPEMQDLPVSLDAPTIQLPRKMKRFLVEVSMDPRFYLAAGTFGEGDSWTPSASLLDCFGPATYFFRICDLDNGKAEPVGVYRYCRSVAETAPESTAVEEVGKSEPAQGKV